MRRARLPTLLALLTLISAAGAPTGLRAGGALYAVWPHSDYKP
jgi:hypothetical protein